MKNKLYSNIKGMRRVGLLLIIIMLTVLPCKASILEEAENTIGENGTIIYKFQLPDDDENEQEETAEQKQQEQEDITSDDITADTNPPIVYEDYDNYDYDKDYIISDMYTDVLKGYAEYNVEEEEGIELEVPDFSLITLNIKKPVSIEEQNFSHLKTTPLFIQNQYSKLNSSEYNIAPMYSSRTKQMGAFSAGTSFGQYIDTGDLENSSSIFSKYQYKRFALTTTYSRTLSSTDSTYTDNLYFAPELRLNQYLTVIERLSANPITKNKKAEFILSINPFGNRETDRLRLDLGASQSYDDKNNVLKSQFRFYTIFKL